MPIRAMSLALFTEDQDRFIVRVLDDFSTDTMTKYCLRVLMVLRHDPLHAVQWAAGEEFEVSISKVVPCASAFVQWELELIEDPAFDAALAKIERMEVAGDGASWASAVVRAVAAEREACARICETFIGGYSHAVTDNVLVPDRDGPWCLNSDLARAIRARGTAPTVASPPGSTT